MRKSYARHLLLVFGTSALLLAAISPTFAKRAPAGIHIQSSKSAYHAREWMRRHRAYTSSHRLVRPHGYAGAYYHRRIYPWDSYETDLLFDCLLSQPLVICP